MQVSYRSASVVIVVLASIWAFVASAVEKQDDAAKAAAEATQREDLRVRSAKAGWLKGVRTVELIRAGRKRQTIASPRLSPNCHGLSFLSWLTASAAANGVTASNGRSTSRRQNGGRGADAVSGRFCGLDAT